ncbi:hemolysin family protein [Enemella sp. A6]|uniref:hemolysin family protein n=1 Tax=Enemella sp. A6 TaxID=3440152 RepID=UPI003EB9BF77
MSTTHIVLLAVAGVLAILAGVLAAIESALHNLTRSRAKALVEEERRGAQRLVDMAEDLHPYVNSVLLVRTAFEVVCVVIFALVIFEYVDRTWLQLLVAGGVMVLVSFLAWEVAPRTLGRQHALRVALLTSGVVSVMATVLGPISQLLIWVGNALTPGKGFDYGPFASEAELREMVDFAEASELIEDRERQMIHSVFELDNTIVKEVMVPRTEVVFIEAHKTLRQATSLALRSGFSRIPVVGEGGLDEVVGICFLKDLMKRMYDNPQAQSSERVESLMRPATFCPDSKAADTLLKEMQTNHSHLVIVVDEFGGMSGVVTIEDLLEEIVGEIVDEYDEEIAPWQELSDERYRVSARLPLDELGVLFGMELDDEDVDSVIGMMAKELNKVPIPGSVVHYQGLELVAERGTGRRNRIATVLASRMADDADDIGAEAAARLATESAQRRT